MYTSVSYILNSIIRCNDYQMQSFLLIFLDLCSKLLVRLTVQADSVSLVVTLSEREQPVKSRIQTEDRTSTSPNTSHTM